MTIATSLGQTYDNEGQFLAAQHDPETYTSNEDQTSGQTSSKVPAGSPDRIYVSPQSGNNPDIEDRRNQSELDALIGYLKDQAGNLGPKLQGILAHPMSSDTANATATLPVQETPLGNQAGLNDIPEPHRTVMEKLLGINGPRYETWPEKVIRHAVSGAELPGDVFAGKADPYDSERVQDLANLAVLGPLPATLATKAETGTLGSFAGIRSIGLDKSKLYQAINLDNEGASIDEIWKTTGFFKGKDGQWRYEIPDQYSRLNTSNLHTVLSNKIGEPSNVRVPEQPRDFSPEEMEDFINDVGRFAPTKLEDVLHHPQLFNAYPALKDLEVHPMPQRYINEYNGIYDPNYKRIYMNELPTDKFKSTLLHEIQHVIQDMEGFSRGGNSSMFTPEKLPAAEKLFESAKEGLIKDATDAGISPYLFEKMMLQIRLLHQGYPEEYLPDIQKSKDLGLFDRMSNIAKGQILLEKQAEKQDELYRRLAGEVEARNVQKRMNMDSVDRFLNNPRTTEDRPSFVQISR